ncbi:MAG: hypothetical protein A2V81_04735 [Candidatus Abawacabacteria bacterium RBG_16_42_10]|uniref:VTT domain-containing protein n=1 Tax=Candidatus Abawacabacteria bacterium RBG_16_42_10 TaxID=1817814 RepID=A0A1F4XJP3_9BACT|nr:MAG: hypothetical protein A2V81_04735 [Candidatus Abawacabacteria bacterium RBG_16_42_10]
MQFFIWLTQSLEALATKVPLEVFVIIGSLVEEIVAPIPSPSILTLAGSIALSQEKTVLFLIWLAILGSIGKTIGGWVLYWIGDKAEDIITKKWGKFFGISHKHIEHLGEKFHKGHKDIILLTFLRSLPIFPSAPISIGCGVIRLPIKVYLLGTFLGTIVRGFIYIYLGYSGLEILKGLSTHLDRTETIIQLAIVVILVLVIAYSYWKRRKSKF